MPSRIVIFGATGYTGELAARALVARGVRPVLAARSADRLAVLADTLGGLETAVADVTDPGSVRSLVEHGDVLVSTVGPFARWGGPAVEAAVDAGAHYLDSTGEPAFIRRVFELHGPRAAVAGCTLLPAFGFDWVPGCLAGAMAIDAAGSDAVRVDVGYFSSGGGISGGTAASTAGAVLEPSFAFRGGRLRSERTAAHARRFDLEGGKVRRGISVGGSEHFDLPAAYPSLRDVSVTLGQAGAVTPYLPLVTGALSVATSIPPIGRTVRSLVERRAKGSTGGPDAETRDSSSTTILAEARSASGALLHRVRLDGPNGYTFTGDILAWGAVAAAQGRVRASGALGPVSAFGLGTLTAAAATLGLAAHQPGHGPVV